MNIILSFRREFLFYNIYFSYPLSQPLYTILNENSGRFLKGRHYYIANYHRGTDDYSPVVSTEILLKWSFFFSGIIGYYPGRNLRWAYSYISGEKTCFLKHSYDVIPLSF